MKNMIYKNLLVLVLVLLVTALFAQPGGGGGGVGGGGAPPGGGAGAPIDGGVVGLLLGAAGYAYKQLNAQEKKQS